jgi:hypothetical protein
MDRFLCSFERSGDCWLWDGHLKKTGYGQMCAFGKHVAAHRIAYYLFKGPFPAEMHVLHSCDVRRCVNPDHLRLGTHADNMRDMAAKGRRRGPSRDKMPWRVLNEADVLEILASDEPGTALAGRYGVTKGAIYAIRNGVTWKDIPR